MNFQAQEDDIAAQLQPALSNYNVQVQTMPESTSEFQRNFEDARVFVAFNGLKSGDPQSTNVIVQEDRLTFAIVLQSRLLRGASGAYNIYEQLRKKLVGYAPSYCGPLYSRSFDLISDEDDLFTFFAEFECTAKLVQVVNDSNFPDVSLGTITQINLDENIH